MRHEHDEEEDVCQAAPRPSLHLIQHGQGEAFTEAETALGRLEGAVVDVLHAGPKVAGNFRFVRAREHEQHLLSRGLRPWLLWRRPNRFQVLPAGWPRRLHVQVGRPGTDRDHLVVTRVRPTRQRWCRCQVGGGVSTWRWRLHRAGHVSKVAPLILPGRITAYKSMSTLFNKYLTPLVNAHAGILSSSGHNLRGHLFTMPPLLELSHRSRVTLAFAHYPELSSPSSVHRHLSVLDAWCPRRRPAN